MIKGRLEGHGDEVGEDLVARVANGGPAQLFDAGPPYSAYVAAAPAAPTRVAGPADAAGPERDVADSGAGARVRSGRGNDRATGATSRGSRDAARAGGAGAGSGGGRNEGRGAATGGENRRKQAVGVAGVGNPGRGSDKAGPGRPARSGLEERMPEDELALEELVLLTGVDVETVRDLERFGLVTPRTVGGAAFYGPDDATIAKLATSFARHGVEARHLRAYKGAAEREAGIVQQVIMPLLRQRNPQARSAAARAAEELSALGGELRAALLRAALADLR